MASYNKCTTCPQKKEKNLLCLNDKCGKIKYFEKICIQCHRLVHRELTQKITEDDIDIVLEIIRQSAADHLKQTQVRILDKGMLDNINNFINSVNSVVEQLESIKSVFTKIVELSNSSHIEYENIIKRIDSITARKDEDNHIARQLNIIKEKIIYNPEGKVQFIHETNKTLIKQNSSGFTQTCKNSMIKIQSALEEMFKFDSVILNTFVKKKGGSNQEDLSDLEKPKPPSEPQGVEEKQLQNEREILVSKIEGNKHTALTSINEMISTMIGKPFAVNIYIKEIISKQLNFQYYKV